VQKLVAVALVLALSACTAPPALRDTQPALSDTPTPKVVGVSYEHCAAVAHHVPSYLSCVALENEYRSQRD